MGAGSDPGGVALDQGFAEGIGDRPEGLHHRFIRPSPVPDDPARSELLNLCPLALSEEDRVEKGEIGMILLLASLHVIEDSNAHLTKPLSESDVACINPL